MPEKKPDPWAEARAKGVYRPEPGDTSGVSAETKEKSGTTAGKGLGKLGKPFVPPKQEQGESPQAYGARVRKARADHEAASAQKKAITK